MKNWNRLQRLPVYIAMAMLGVGATSCGGSAVTYGVSAGTSSSSLTNLPAPAPSSDTGTSPLSYYFSINGPGGTTPKFTTGSGTLINTDNLLQVQVVAGSATEATVPGYSTAFSASYNCISYIVTVYDQNGAVLSSQQTGTLAVTPSQQDLCPGAANSVTLNFNSVVSNGSHGGVSVGITANQYDYYCQLWYNYYDEGNYSFYQDYNFMCPLHAVYSTHTVTGTLNIQTNGTEI